MPSKSVLLTGGAGLIGSHLCDSLLQQDYAVTVVDNFISGNPKNIEQHKSDPNFQFIDADASNAPETYLAPDAHFDYIFHLASPASPIRYQKHPVATYIVNACGTHFLLEYAKKTNARFLYASTSEVYGDPEVHPQRESYWGNVNPNGTRACYDESKRFGEMACMTFYRSFGVDVRIVRIFNTYGPRNDPKDGRVVPNFIMQALRNEPITIYGNGTQTRSFCYVSDLVRGIESVMFAENQAGVVVNLGNPHEFTIIDFAHLVKDLAHSSSEIVFEALPDDDPKKRQPDISKAKSLFNWEPVVSLEDGLKTTLEYYRNLLQVYE